MEDNGMDETNDLPEAEELEAAAMWRLRKVDAEPTDSASAAAAERLQMLANDLRAHGHTPLLAEYRCICNWLAESDGIEDFNHFAHEYRVGIGTLHAPDSGDAYIRVLISLAKDAFGAP